MSNLNLSTVALLSVHAITILTIAPVTSQRGKQRHQSLTISMIKKMDKCTFEIQLNSLCMIKVRTCIVVSDNEPLSVGHTRLSCNWVKPASSGSMSNEECCTRSRYRADSRLAPSQWETLLQSNAVSHWLGATLESALRYPGQGQQLHPTVHVGCNYFSLPLIPPSGTTLLKCCRYRHTPPTHICVTFGESD